MKRFARLYAELDATTATSRKVEAMRAYFADAPPGDAAWGLWFLLGHRLKRTIAPSKLHAWLVELSQLPASVIEESVAQVGDFAETAALVLDTLGLSDQAPRPSAESGSGSGFEPPSRGLRAMVEALLAVAEADESVQHEHVVTTWRSLPFLECFLYTKLLTGALRVGVSSGLAVRALAAHAGLDETLVQARLMGEWMPGEAAFAALIEPGTGERNASQPYPFCLANPLEGEPSAIGGPEEFLVEWKWDGIRAQVIRREGRTWIWSRGEELLDGRFPEVEAAAAHLPDGTVLDGEILALRDAVLPFAVLQKRIGRKTLSKKTLAEAPVTLLAYDLLELDGIDVRDQPLSARRARLDALIATSRDEVRTAIRVSEPVEASTWESRAALRETSRERGVEGFMLKRLDSAYVAGRRRGAWWKWKIGAMTVDTVLIYAQPGSGRRSNLYTDYTLAVWDGEVLVPVAKAYSGLNDEELNAMDRWIRANTKEKFGPVRSLEPVQVFEIAFEGIQASARHKAGVALRFPRIARWRQDKTAEQADRLEELKKRIR